MKKIKIQNKNMTAGKKLMSLLLMVCMCFAVTACGNNRTVSGSRTDTAAQSEAPDAMSSSEAEGENTAGSPAEKTESFEIAEGTKTLVVYFSMTGNTKAIAENIAGGLSADLYEILAEDPYTAEDLNYNDDNSRSSMEMNDPSARPAISGSIDNIDQYDTIYIGYPIWWGEAPRIMDTFVENYDFSDKTVIPFCTSGSSEIGSSAKNLEQIAGSGNWKDGKRFGGSESSDEIMEWVLGL